MKLVWLDFGDQTVRICRRVLGLLHFSGSVVVQEKRKWTFDHSVKAASASKCRQMAFFLMQNDANTATRQTEMARFLSENSVSDLSVKSRVHLCDLRQFSGFLPSRLLFPTWVTHFETHMLSPNFQTEICHGAHSRIQIVHQTLTTASQSCVFFT